MSSGTTFFYSPKTINITYNNLNTLMNSDIVNPPTLIPNLSISGSYSTDLKSVEVSADIINGLGTEKIQYYDNNIWNDYISPITFTENRKIIFKLLSSTGVTLDSIDYEITAIIKMDNSNMQFTINYMMQDFKAYFTPTATGVLSYNTGVRVKLIDGFNNIVETGYEEFIEKNINEQFILTGKKDTVFTLLFQFYNKTTLETIQNNTLTVVVQDGTGIITDNSESTDTSNFPVFPLGSINPIDYFVYVFDLIVALINMLISFLGTIITGITSIGGLLALAFNFFPAPIPQLFIIGIIVSILMSIKK